MEWFLKQKGKEVNGFVNHWWNGVTTREYARIVEQIVDQGLYFESIRHVFSDALTKYEMLVQFRNLFQYHDTIIHPVDAPEKIDRTLATKYADLLTKLQIRSFGEMVNDLLVGPGGLEIFSGSDEMREAR